MLPVLKSVTNAAHLALRQDWQEGQAQCQNPVNSGEDAGDLLLDHPGGVWAVFDGNWCLDQAAGNLRRTKIEALIEENDGALSLAGDGSVRLRAFGSTRDEVLLTRDICHGLGNDCMHALQCHVVNGFLYRCPPENLAEDFLAVSTIEEAV